MTGPDNDALESHANEGYRSVGRYVTEFSRLVWVMREVMTFRLTSRGDPPGLVDPLFGRTSADTMTNAFFAMCRTLMDHDSDELAASEKLEKVIGEQIRRRNALVHSDLEIGYWVRTGGEEESKPVPPGYRRLVGGYESPDLDAHSDELERLRGLVRQYGVLCLGLGMHHPEAKRVRDILVLSDERRPDFGPLATRGVWRI